MSVPDETRHRTMIRELKRRLDFVALLTLYVVAFALTVLLDTAGPHLKALPSALDVALAMQGWLFR